MSAPATTDGASRTPVSAGTGYYGLPVIKRPHWKWLIIFYFFLGGISAATHIVATLANYRDPRGNRRIVRAGRYLSFAALLPCPILLVLDLKRPERFYRMLRVVKLRSPMSLGTWALTAFGAASGVAALAQASAEIPLPNAIARHRRLDPETTATVAGLAGMPAATFVGGYTGVLLAATAVPLWAKRAQLLGPLFLSSALATGTAAINAFLALDRHADHAARSRASRFEAICSLVEAALLTSWVMRLGSTARPIVDGRTGAILRHGTLGLGIVVPLLLHGVAERLPERGARALAGLAAIAALVGGFALRYAVVVAGLQSADDPQATFEFTRIRDNRA